jgi:hypothetical protein
MRRIGPVVSALALGAVLIAAAPAAPPEPADHSPLQFRIAEPVLIDWLRAVTPFTVTVGKPPLATDLIFSDPADLVLKAGEARFKVRVRGRPLPVDQMLEPVVAVRYEPESRRYLLVVSSLPVQLPGLGTVDIRSYFPRLEIPALLENLWRSDERPYGLNLTIRRVRILDHAIEVGAEARFTATATARQDGSGELHGR